MVRRRQLLTGAAALLGVSALPGVVSVGRGPAGQGVARAQSRSETIELRAPGGPTGRYLYLPFEVPAGVNRIDGQTIDKGGATTGLGLFDQRGAGYQSPGFRGIFGGELAEFSVAADRASRSFLPGTIEPGTWTAIVPVFTQGPDPTADVVVEITLHFGRQAAPLPLTAGAGVVNPSPGWYRGDLHCHTPESSDAWSSGTAMTPRQWAAECRRVGLDFASMTDHNVVSQNLALVDDTTAGAGVDSGVLLIAGEEMTNWFHGHATVTGLQPGEWLDWRQRPMGVPLFDNEARITEFIGITREMGVYTAAAHPFGPSVGLPWTFLPEGIADPDAFPDGFEVWTGDFQPDDETALATWDTLLQAGRKITANGGSDLHGTRNTLQPAGAGTPTTVVYAESLSTDAIVEATRAGRCFVTRAPNGGELYLTATGPGGQQTFTGGTVVGAPTDTVEVEVLVRRGALLSADPTLRLILISNGVALSTTPITQQEQTVGLTVPIGLGGYVRAELRGQPFVDPTSPIASRLDMEALTNPIWLALDGEAVEESAPPPTDRARRLRDHMEALEVVAPAAAAAAVAAPAATVHTGPALPGPLSDSSRGGGTRQASEGGGPAMTLTEVVWHAGCDGELEGRAVQLTGVVTLADPAQDDVVLLRRWVRDCCAIDGREVVVRLRGWPADRAPDWVTVQARWVPGTGRGFTEAPLLQVQRCLPATSTDRFEA